MKQNQAVDVTRDSFKDNDWVADFLGVSRRTLPCWRSQGIGPPYYKANRRVLYRIGDVLDWVGQHRMIHPDKPDPEGRKGAAA